MRCVNCRHRIVRVGWVIGQIRAVGHFGKNMVGEDAVTKSCLAPGCGCQNPRETI